MNKGKLLALAAIVCLLQAACNTASPEKYFDIAVLNCNMMYGFAGDGMSRQLESPSVKMVNGNKDEFAPMKRKEVIESRVRSIEPNLQKIRDLKTTGETKEMLEASEALYNYVLPVYKNEYYQLAALYDEGASQEEIQAYTQSISDKYYDGYVKHFTRLETAAKLFAEKHGINVNWGIKATPQ